MAGKLRNLKTINKILPYFIIILKNLFFFAEDKYLQIKSINKLLARPKLLHGNTLHLHALSTSKLIETYLEAPDHQLFIT